MSYDYYTAHPWLHDALHEQDKNKYANRWRRHFTAAEDTILKSLKVSPTAEDIDRFPPYTLLLQTTFTLKTPYLSRDETDFYLLDHPVRKESVFKVPMIAASSWKGALRSALFRLDPAPDETAVERIFGSVREDEEEEGQAGCLYCFPSFFLDAAPTLEVINPHDRQTGVGSKGPISLEAVPAGSSATWALAYLPPLDDAAAKLAADIPWLAQGVRAVLTVYGIGAKTSSGYGLATGGHGDLTLRAAITRAEASTAPGAPPEPELPRYLETPDRLSSEFSREDGSLIDEAAYRRYLDSEGLTYNSSRKRLYKKAKKWWAEEGSQQAPAPAPEAPSETAAVTTLSFVTLDELVDLAKDVARQGEEQA